MSVYIHVGQCGNQLGAAYWQLTAAAESTVNSSSAHRTNKPIQSTTRTPRRAPSFDHFYHRVTGKARCILIDSEPKVVRTVLAHRTAENVNTTNVKKPSTWHWNPAQVHYEQSGRGNNWAMGYNFQRYKRATIPPRPPSTTRATGTIGHQSNTISFRASIQNGDGKQELMELAMDSLQKEIETIDCFQGTVLMHSMGGGTGAGLGCRLLELIRDTYPKPYLVTASIAPSLSCGDTPLQNYNAVFTLSHLQEYADCVIYKDNDNLLRTAAYWKALQAYSKDGSDSSTNNERAQPQISLDELNHIAAADIAGLLFPITSPPAITTSSALVAARPFDFGKLIYDLCPSPTSKFINVTTGILRKIARASSPQQKRKATPLFHATFIRHSLSARNGINEDVDAILGKLLRQTLQSLERASYPSLTASCIIRGFPNFTPEHRMTETLQTQVDSTLPRIDWNQESRTSLLYSSETPFSSHGGVATATVCVNNGHVVNSAQQYLQRAQHQYKANAYVHWYKQYGLDESDFLEAFNNCGQIVNEYATILR